MATTQAVIAALRAAGKQTKQVHRGKVTRAGYTCAKLQRGFVGVLANTDDEAEIGAYSSALAGAGFHVERRADCAVDALIVS